MATNAIANSGSLFARTVNGLERGWRACETFESAADNATLYKIPFFKGACQFLAKVLPVNLLSLPILNFSSKNDWFSTGLLPKLNNNIDSNIPKDEPSANKTEIKNELWSEHIASFARNYSQGVKNNWPRFKHLWAGTIVKVGGEFSAGVTALKFIKNAAITLIFGLEALVRTAVTLAHAGYNLGLYSIKAGKTAVYAIVFAAAWLLAQCFKRVVACGLASADACLNPDPVINTSPCLGNASGVDEFKKNKPENDLGSEVRQLHPQPSGKGVASLEGVNDYPSSQHQILWSPQDRFARAPNQNLEERTVQQTGASFSNSFSGFGTNTGKVVAVPPSGWSFAFNDGNNKPHSDWQRSLSGEYDAMPGSSETFWRSNDDTLGFEGVVDSRAPESPTSNGGDNKPLSVSLHVDEMQKVSVKLNLAKKQRQQNEIQPVSSVRNSPTNTTASNDLGLPLHNLPRL